MKTNFVLNNIFLYMLSILAFEKKNWYWQNSVLAGHTNKQKISN